MAESPGRRRAWVRVLRALLWPIARMRPESAWARMYRRLEAIEHEAIPLATRLRSPKVWLGVLLAAAAVLWLRDVIHGSNARRPSVDVGSRR